MEEDEEYGLGILGCDNVDDALKTMLATTEAWLESQGWDQPARMFIISVIPDIGMEVREAPHFDRTLCTDLHGFFPQVVHCLMDPDDPTREAGLAALSKALPPYFYGIMLFTEAWSVKEPTDKESPEYHSVREASQRRALHEHPDRQEIRMGMFASLDDRLLHMQRFRGEEAEEPTEESAVMWGQSAQFTGGVPLTLHRFVQLCASQAPSCRVIR